MDVIAKSNILVVDDTVKNVQILGQILKQKGASVSFALDGQQAFDIVSQKTPDLILLDIIMPNMDGYEVCRRLKENKDTQNIPIIFMSALSETEDKVQGFALGAVDYITKPFFAEEVIARVTTHITINNFTRQLQEKNTHLQLLMRSFRIFVAVTIFMFSFLICLHSFIKLLTQYFPVEWVSLSIGVVMIAACSIVFRTINMPKEQLGLTIKNWKMSLIEGVALSVALIGIFFIISPQNRFGEISYLFLTGDRMALYMIFAFIQELAFRGVFQTALHNFYQDNGNISIAIASLPFAVIHAHLGMPMVFICYFVGLFLGKLYFRHENLLGITIIHIVLGIMGISLGYI